MGGNHPPEWVATLARNGGNFAPEYSDMGRNSQSIAQYYQMGPMGGPMYLKWNNNEKVKTSTADAKNALGILKERWMEITGPEIGPATMPLRLTGAKGRRLVVAVLNEIVPPWGTWTTLERDERRHAFTKLRTAINLAIKPVEVDHIDFVRQSPKSSDGTMLQ